MSLNWGVQWLTEGEEEAEMEEVTGVEMVVGVEMEGVDVAEVEMAGMENEAVDFRTTLLPHDFEAGMLDMFAMFKALFFGFIFFLDDCMIKRCAYTFGYDKPII